MDRIELNDVVLDMISGFTGVVVGITNWLNGCTRIGIQATELKDGLPLDIQWIDDTQCDILEKNGGGKRKHPAKESGGPTPTPTRNADPKY